jgi:ribosomal protein L11 methyltransferase
MDWQEVSWSVQNPDRQALEDLLQELGALVVSTSGSAQEAVFESTPVDQPGWQQVRVTALFEATRALQPVMDAVQAALTGRATDPARRTLRDRDWVREWSRGLQPQCFADRLWVVPREQQAPEAATCVVHMDPGLAFGSGTHETTRLCLEWLVQQDLRGRTVLDYGCGSGLLGIAALKCGAARVVACDNDPQAVQVTRDNARRNDVTDRLTVGLPDEIAAHSGDILLANILLEALLGYAEHFARCVLPGGQLVLSGVLFDQLATLLQAYEADFEDFDVRRIGEWVCVIGQRRVT